MATRWNTGPAEQVWRARPPGWQQGRGLDGLVAVLTYRTRHVKSSLIYSGWSFLTLEVEFQKTLTQDGKELSSHLRPTRERAASGPGQGHTEVDLRELWG